MCLCVDSCIWPIVPNQIQAKSLFVLKTTIPPQIQRTNSNAQVPSSLHCFFFLFFVSYISVCNGHTWLELHCSFKSNPKSKCQYHPIHPSIQQPSTTIHLPPQFPSLISPHPRYCTFLFIHSTTPHLVPRVRETEKKKLLFPPSLPLFFFIEIVGGSRLFCGLVVLSMVHWAIVSMHCGLSFLYLVGERVCT